MCSCDRVVFCRSDKLFLDFECVFITSTFFLLNLEEGVRVVVALVYCLPSSLTESLEIDFIVISIYSYNSFHVCARAATILVSISAQRLYLQICSSAERGMPSRPL